MKISSLLVLLAVAACLLLAPQQASAQRIYGYTSASYSRTTNTITGTSITELDYAVQDTYQAIVNARIIDHHGNTVANRTVTDTDRDGLVAVSVQASGAYATAYKVVGHHQARMSVQDPAMGYQYLDYYNFWDMRFTNEGYMVPFNFTWFGPGPLKRRTFSTIHMGNTFARAKAEVTLGTLILSRATIGTGKPAGTNETAIITAPISLSQSGLEWQPGDYALVELNRMTAGSTFNFPSPGGNEEAGNLKKVLLTPIQTTDVRFAITADHPTSGQYEFQIRIHDVLRPSTTGGAPTSLFDKVTFGKRTDEVTITVR